MSENIFAAFNESADAEKAAGALMDHGVHASDIGLVISDEYRLHHSAVNDPELQYIQPTITLGGPGRSDQSDPLGNELRTSGAVPIMGGELGPRSEVPELVRIEKEPFEEISFNSGIPEYDPEIAAKKGVTTTTPHDATVGAVKGLGVGAGVGALAALAAVTIPGFGLVLGGGALAMAIASFAGSAGAGAVAGGIFGFLKDQGIPESQVAVFEKCCGEGGAVLSVTIREGFSSADVERIVAKYGAIKVDRFAYTA